MTLLKPGVARVLGWVTLTSLVVLAMFGLWGAPPDEVQSDAQRLMYLHVPAAWVATTSAQRRRRSGGTVSGLSCPPASSVYQKV